MKSMPYNKLRKRKTKISIINEIEFIGKIDANFPYDDEEKWKAVIDESNLESGVYASCFDLNLLVLDFNLTYGP